MTPLLIAIGPGWPTSGKSMFVATGEEDVQRTAPVAGLIAVTCSK